MAEQFSNGVAFQLGLTVTVPAPPKKPDNITMQDEVRVWLEESNITEWELRWADVTGPGNLLEPEERRKHTLDTFLIFYRPQDAVLFKVAFGGRLKGKGKPKPRNIVDLSV